MNTATPAPTDAESKEVARNRLVRAYLKGLTEGVVFGLVVGAIVTFAIATHD